jgi:EAL domain-containing protein (putative c-di-GMP-specific phosphodiesterase class I)
MLTSLGVDLAQGFLLGRPAPTLARPRRVAALPAAPRKTLSPA